jgi:hypothetical protein
MGNRAVARTKMLAKIVIMGLTLCINSPDIINIMNYPATIYGAAKPI